MSRSARKGRDERGEHDQPGIGHQLGDFADPADILDPVGLGKAQILVEAVAHIVAVEQEGVPVHQVQRLFHLIGDGRFARARQPGEPQHARLSGFSARHVRSRPMSSRLPMDILRTAQAEVEHPGSQRCALVILSIRMKPPSVRLVGIGFEHDWLVGGQFGHADRV